MFPKPLSPLMYTHQHVAGGGVQYYTFKIRQQYLLRGAVLLSVGICLFLNPLMGA